jgi:serine phosphatase RsbU (regulator of sigma subunit)
MIGRERGHFYGWLTIQPSGDSPFRKKGFSFPIWMVRAGPLSCGKDILTSPRSRFREDPLMNKLLHKWWGGLGTAYPSAASSYWRTMPLGRLKKLLAAAFFTVSVFGFVLDLLLLNHPHLGRGLVWPLLMGAMAAGTLAARIKRTRLYTPIHLILLAVCCLALILPYTSARLPVPEALKQRVAFDAIAILLCTALSYRLLQSFLSYEGLASVRMQTELSLARGIQATLVPTISFQNSTFEVYGKSIPSAEMGGDLIDVIQSDGSLLAYIADISGHGLAAGQLMGMVKTAMRVSLQFRQHPVALLESADRVLPAVKEPDMYATLALLHFDGSAQAEYALAGHVPILHYRDRSRDTVRLSMEQFPLGLIPGGCYASQRVTYLSRDLFLMLTDGISEVSNESDEEFGLARLEQLLTQYAAQPLPHIWELIMEQVHQHGLQQDDQTLLLVRARY